MASPIEGSPPWRKRVRHQLFTFDSDGKLHQLTNTQYMATKPTFGRLVTGH